MPCTALAQSLWVSVHDHSLWTKRTIERYHRKTSRVWSLYCRSALLAEPQAWYPFLFTDIVRMHRTLLSISRIYTYWNTQKNTRPAMLHYVRQMWGKHCCLARIPPLFNIDVREKHENKRKGCARNIWPWPGMLGQKRALFSCFVVASGVLHAAGGKNTLNTRYTFRCDWDRGECHTHVAHTT